VNKNEYYSLPDSFKDEESILYSKVYLLKSFQPSIGMKISHK